MDTICVHHKALIFAYQVEHHIHLFKNKTFCNQVYNKSKQFGFIALPATLYS